MFTALFITWKQAKIPFNSEWIKTVVQSDNGILSNHAKPWINIKRYIKWKKKQSEKATYCMIPTI